MQIVFLLVGVAALMSAKVNAQIDVSASLYGAFSGSTTGNGIVQSTSNAAGALFEVRRITRPWFGYEGTYSINRANQAYSYSTVPVSCPTPPVNCSPVSAAVSANAHELTGDWVASLKVANLRPFALAGVGLLFNEPVGEQANTNSSTKPVFVYGLGADWGMLPHLGLRFQYRGNIYKAPGLSTVINSSGAAMHTAEPMIGAYFRF
jgi:opacity protein-like surface antigen